ncbi:MAG: radical SAM protein [Planctomycetes bacterium]|nr:radical SAM protein [Planctomycetota bacterium]
MKEIRTGATDGHGSQVVSLIVDATYRCNARCAYCRWGDGRTFERADAPISELCLSSDWLASARIGRVVFSGGEPLLHPSLPTAITHYQSQGVVERVVITNGLRADQARVAQCLRAGATGITFSIDAVDASVVEVARRMSRTQHERVLRNLSDTCSHARSRSLEVSVNCVLSAANCSVSTVQELAEHASSLGVTAVKFQPIFDDGYLGTNAPQLQLGATHAAVIREMGADTVNWGISTNPRSFFFELADLLEGATLPGRSCRLGGRTYVLQPDGLVICPWIHAPVIAACDDLPNKIRDFAAMTASCSTGPNCFCLQPREQRWFDALS